MNHFSRKSQIISTALKMFNEQGVENVTTRHIAKEIGISQGNLHYHYPNKNKILEQIFENLMHDLSEAKQFKGESLTAEQMMQSMLDNFKIMHQYRLFFQQNDVIWRRLPQIKKHMLELYRSKHAEFLQLISAFKKENKLREGVTETQMTTLAEQLIFTIQSWLVLQHYESKKTPHKYYAKFLFRLWLPYLNKKELVIWEKVLST